MKNALLGVLLTLLVVLGVRYYESEQEETRTTFGAAQILQQQIQNVGKLIVTEGHFSEVISYKDVQKYYMDLYSSEKKALVIVNAKATIAYDLSKIKYTLSEATKTLRITDIPEAEIDLSPDMHYYDIQQEFLNPFSAADYNKIKTKVNQQLRSKIESSSLKTNAKNRLISELQQLFVLTHALGWTLQYEEKKLTQNEQIERLLRSQN